MVALVLLVLCSSPKLHACMYLVSEQLPMPGMTIIQNYVGIHTCIYKYKCHYTVQPLLNKQLDFAKKHGNLENEYWEHFQHFQTSLKKDIPSQTILKRVHFRTEFEQIRHWIGAQVLDPGPGYLFKLNPRTLFSKYCVKGFLFQTVLNMGTGLTPHVPHVFCFIIVSQESRSASAVERHVPPSEQWAIIELAEQWACRKFVKEPCHSTTFQSRLMEWFC